MTTHILHIKLMENNAEAQIVVPFVRSVVVAVRA